MRGVAPSCSTRLAGPTRSSWSARSSRWPGAHTIPLPNVDLAMAAIAWSTGMPPDAGRTLFTVARVAGWVAHYLEELGERPLRFRAAPSSLAASGRS